MNTQPKSNRLMPIVKEKAIFTENKLL